MSFEETFGIIFSDSFFSFIRLVYWNPLCFYFLFSNLKHVLLFCGSFFSSLHDEHRFMGVADSELFNLFIVLNELFKKFLYFVSPIFLYVLVAIEGVLDFLSTNILLSFYHLGDETPLRFFSETSICSIFRFSSRSSLFIFSSSSLKFFI